MHLEPGDSVWDECGLYRLRKCPFCGEYPEWQYKEAEEEGELDWSVHCTSKACHLKPSTSWTVGVEFAALKWNHRFSISEARKREA